MNTTEYLLSCLVKECAEVIQRATKAQRFGLKEVQPEQESTNEERLAAELDDLLGTLSLLAEQGVHLSSSSERVRTKILKVEKFMDYSRELGALHR